MRSELRKSERQPGSRGSLQKRYERGRRASAGFLRDMLERACGAVAGGSAIKEVPGGMRGQTAPTESFGSLKGADTPSWSRASWPTSTRSCAVRVDGWQDTAKGDREVQQALRRTLYVRNKMRGQDLLEGTRVRPRGLLGIRALNGTLLARMCRRPHGVAATGGAAC